MSAVLNDPNEVKPIYRVATLAETWQQQLCQESMGAPDIYGALARRIASNGFNALASLGTSAFTAYTAVGQLAQGHWGIGTFALVATPISLFLAYDAARILRAELHLQNINRKYGAEVTREMIRRTAEFHDQARP